MDETTDKSPSPADSTDDAKPTDAPLDDKDLGQEATDTGEAHDDSGTQDDAPSDDSEGEEAQPEDDETTSDDEGSEDEETPEAKEPQLLTPEEVAKLPPELKAQYRSMNQRFQERMKAANEIVREAQAIRDGGSEDGGDKPSAPSVVDRVLQRRGIDPKSVKAQVRETLDLVAEVAQEASGDKANEALAPIINKELKSEVDGYFAKHPEQTKYRRQMGELDKATEGRLTLTQLYHAVAGKDLEAKAQERRDSKLREQAKGNSESSTGTTGGDKDGGDIFDEIAMAGGHDPNSPLL